MTGHTYRQKGRNVARLILPGRERGRGRGRGESSGPAGADPTLAPLLVLLVLQPPFQLPESFSPSHPLPPPPSPRKIEPGMWS